MPTTKTSQCSICTAEFRCDYLGRHMTTHARNLIKRDPRMREDCVADRCPVVSFRRSAVEESGARKSQTLTAHCLVCGAHDYCTNPPWRYDHAQWCETCRAPFAEECSGCLRKSRVQKPTAPNKCDDFISRHTESCGARWDSVAVWFDLTKPEPKKCAVANRKTERKLPARPKPAEVVPTVPTVPTVPISSGRTDDEIRETLEAAFPDVFDDYWREDLEENEETPTFDGMVSSISKTMDSMEKQLKKFRTNNEAVIAARVAAAEKRAHEEVQIVERERIAETDRANRLRDELESTNITMTQQARTMSNMRHYISSLQQLLRDAGIEFEPE